MRPPAPYVAHIKTEVQLSSARAPGNDVEENFTILRAFRAAVAPEGTLEYVEASNSIVVTGTSPKLDSLKRLIAQVDLEPVMVGVDIQFITTRNQDFLEAGFDPGEQNREKPTAGPPSPSKRYPASRRNSLTGYPR